MVTAVPPADPLLEDCLSATYDELLALLKAYATWLGVPATQIVDEQTTAITAAPAPYLLVRAAEEREVFGPNIQPESGKTEADIDVVVKVAQAAGWGPALRSLKHKVRVAVLTNAEFMRTFGPVVRLATRPFLDDQDIEVAGIAVITFTFGYATSYPPVVPDDLTTVHIDLDAIDPADPNVAPNGGPDGRIEGAASWPIDV